MNDQHKSKIELIEELRTLRQQLSELQLAQTPSSALRRSSHQDDEFKTLVDNSPDAIIRFNHSLEILFANSLAIQVLGIPADGYIGKNPSDLFPIASYYNFWKTSIEKLFTTKEPSVFEGEFTNYQGEHFHYHALLVPEFGPDGQVDSALCTVRDISELTHLKQELTRLDQLNLVGEMAASIGHEVRNPMTTVRGFLQLFSRKPEFASYKEHFNLLIEELDRANGIISEFLSLAKNKPLKLEQQNLNTIINAISPLIRSNATMSNKSLSLQLGHIPDLLLDDHEIRQLILNLVRNGLESMEPDTTITIRTFTENNYVVMAIEDTGGGIPPELIEKLGIPFFTTKDSGTGLGLAICYSIAARHKASIKVATSPSGTTFFIKFDQ